MHVQVLAVCTRTVVHFHFLNAQNKRGLTVLQNVIIIPAFLQSACSEEYLTYRNITLNLKDKLAKRKDRL